MTILQAEALVKHYSRRTVVDGVSLGIETGEIVGILGPNGAGKTTTFRMICGITRPDGGRVLLRGEDVTRWPMYVRAKQGGMGYLPQQSSVFAKLSAEDNLIGIMQLLGMKRSTIRERTEQLLAQFKITHIRRTAAGRLSGGERRRLEIARCLISNPKIIMLDEPFAGIDPVTVQNIQVIIRELADQGISILITDHAAREILQIADRTYVVSEGQLLCQGTAEEIIQHEEVKRKYLGEIGDITSKAYPKKTRLSIRETSVATDRIGEHSNELVADYSDETNIPVRASNSNDSIRPNEPKVEAPKGRFFRPMKLVKPAERTISAPFRATDLD